MEDIEKYENINKNRLDELSSLVFQKKITIASCPFMQVLPKLYQGSVKPFKSLFLNS